ncbi:MAG TPA: hypothetical protein VLE22_00850, partial [Bryobacteraceae bacterium]|nr:hypothetical protein [Bryobacteraceae bacterium]
PARRITVTVDGVQVADKTFAAPGTYTLTSEPVVTLSDSPTVTITADRTFSVAGDHRKLGVILSAVGFER